MQNVQLRNLFCYCWAIMVYTSALKE